MKYVLVAIVDGGGVLLYGFYYFTSCPVGLLCLNWRISAAARVKNRTLRKDSVAAAPCRAWDAAETFRSGPVEMLSLTRVAAISSAATRRSRPRWKWAVTPTGRGWGCLVGTMAALWEDKRASGWRRGITGYCKNQSSFNHKPALAIKHWGKLRDRRFSAWLLMLSKWIDKKCF